MHMQLGGILTALATLYSNDGSLDIDAMRRHVNQLKAAGIHGIFVCGTTGEGALLSAIEKREVITAVVSETNGSIPVGAAVIQTDTRSVVEETMSFADMGIQFVAVVAPYYIRVDNTELIEHFKTVAKKSPLPVVVYDIPGNTANPLSDEVYDAVLNDANIVAVKDSSGDFSRFSRRVIAQQKDDESAVNWIQGEDTLDVASLLIGADGVVSGLSNILPEPFVRLYDAARRYDVETAIALQRVINTLHGVVRRTGKGVAAIRLALSQLGFGSRYLRSRGFSLGPEWDDLIRSDVESASSLLDSLRGGK